MIVYIIVLWAASLLLGYTLAFNGATLTIGKSISDSNSPTGFHDVITPPWSTNVALLSYAVSIGVIGYGWYEYGWLTGLGITFGFFFLVPLNTTPTYGNFRYKTTKSLDMMPCKHWDFSIALLDQIDRKHETSE